PRRARRRTGSAGPGPGPRIPARLRAARRPRLGHRARVPPPATRCARSPRRGRHRAKPRARFTMPERATVAAHMASGGDDDALAAEDAELVRAMASGDREALAKLYERHSQILLGLALRIVRERREAEDLLHDVFLEAWRCAKDFDPNRGRVRTWLAIRMRSRA